MGKWNMLLLVSSILMQIIMILIDPLRYSFIEFDENNLLFEKINSDAKTVLPKLYVDRRFSDIEKTRINESYQYLASTITNPDFASCIDTQSKRWISIVGPISSVSTEFLHPILTSKGNLYISKINKKNNNTGETPLEIFTKHNTDNFKLAINTQYYFSSAKSDKYLRANTIFHEMIHNEGFDHIKITPTTKDKDVWGDAMYEAGWCVLRLAPTTP
jgi:hypothetical protein